MKKYLFFDTETTGLPKNWKASMTDVDNWPRVIELGFQVYDENQNRLFSFNELIKPDGWVIPTGEFWVNNGFNTERSLNEGVPIKYALKQFREWHDQCDYMVAHNISYDYNVLGAEFIRARVRCEKKLEQICTKESTTHFCKLIAGYGKYKWPTLNELHQKLFNEDMVDAHKADIDVEYLAKCFFESVKRKIIVL